MAITDDIITEENNAASLIRESRSVRLPPRTIAWQHSNGNAGSRGITRRVLEVKKQRMHINNRIVASQRKAKSLRESILGI
jgi:hypothetical protein